MLLLEDIFDTFGQASQSFKHLKLVVWLPLKESDKVKITFWGINYDGKDCLLYQWKFLPFGLKNTLAKF
jgi:hypothetical protein